MDFCVCIGENAGSEFTNERYRFCVRIGEKIIGTTMTPEEYIHVSNVVSRSAEKGNQRNVGSISGERE